MISTNKIIWFLIRYTLLIDSVNGFFLNAGQNIYISQSVKIILICLIALELLKTSARISVFLILFYVSFLQLHFIFNGVQLGETFNHLFKFLSVILFYLYFRYSFIRNKDLTLDRICRSVKINTVVLTGNIMIGLLGLGYASYGEDLGFKGFFYAGNEISGVLLLLAPFVLYKQILAAGTFTKKYILLALLLLATSLLIVTKTAILGIILSLFLIPKIIPQREHKKKHISFFLLKLFVLVLLSILLYIGIDQSGILEHWTYFYERDGMRFFLSGRDDNLIGELNAYLQGNCSVHLFGLGGNRTVEMDPFDSLINYGITGLVLLYVFYFCLFIKSWKYKKTRVFAPLAFFCNILILFASTFSGHILFSGMAGIFIAMINSLVFYKGDKINKPMCQCKT